MDLSPANIVRRGPRPGRAFRLTLSEIRRAVEMTQAEVAAIIGHGQDEVSRLEKREDMLVSSLRRYVEALGAQLEVTVILGDSGRRIQLAGLK